MLCFVPEPRAAPQLFSSRPPLLSADQLHWISEELWVAGQGKGAATNFLVFGLGELALLRALSSS